MVRDRASRSEHRLARVAAGTKRRRQRRGRFGSSLRASLRRDPLGGFGTRGRRDGTAGAQLPGLPRGVPPFEALLRPRRRATARRTGIGPFFPGDDLPDLPAWIHIRRELLPRGFGRVGAVRALRSVECDPATDPPRLPQDLPGVWGATRRCPSVLRSGRSRARGRKLRNDPRIGVDRVQRTRGEPSWTSCS